MFLSITFSTQHYSLIITQLKEKCKLKTIKSACSVRILLVLLAKHRHLSSPPTATTAPLSERKNAPQPLAKTHATPHSNRWLLHVMQRKRGYASINFRFGKANYRTRSSSSVASLLCRRNGFLGSSLDLESLMSHHHSTGATTSLLV